MTIRVKIANVEDSPDQVCVQTVNSRGEAQETHALAPGDSIELYVYPGQNILVSEPPVDGEEVELEMTRVGR